MERPRSSVCVAYVEGWIRTVAVAGSVRGCGRCGRDGRGADAGHRVGEGDGDAPFGFVGEPAGDGGVGFVDGDRPTPCAGVLIEEVLCIGRECVVGGEHDSQRVAAAEPCWKAAIEAMPDKTRARSPGRHTERSRGQSTCHDSRRSVTSCKELPHLDSC